MKKGVLIAVLVLLAVLVVVSGCADYYITGQIADEQEFGIAQGRLEPALSNIKISFRPTNQSVLNETPLRTVLTNEEGMYYVQLPPNYYRVEVSYENLEEQGYRYLKFGVMKVEVENVSIRNFILTPLNSNYWHDRVVVYFNLSYDKDKAELLIKRTNGSIHSYSKSEKIGDNNPIEVYRYVVEIPFDKTVEEMMEVYNSSEGVLLVRKSGMTSFG